MADSRSTMKKPMQQLGQQRGTKRRTNKENNNFSNNAIPRVGNNDLEGRSWKYMYANPPDGDITLEEFEELAFSRVQLLRVVEEASVRLKDTALELKIRDAITEHLQNDDRNDYISHHILRLAYSQSDNLRKWFLKQECLLFRYRLTKLMSKEYVIIAKNNKLDYDEVEADEKSMFMEDLIQMERSLNNNVPPVDETKINNTTYFKVDFTQVLSLVARRQVFLHRGKAYVPQTLLISLLEQAFREKLSKSLATISKLRSQLEESEGDRLLSLLNGIASHESLAGKREYKALNLLGEVRPRQLDELSKSSFPLCMKNLHAQLRANHHLKHMGRLQYGLFLKGVGLTLEDALEFWRGEFSKIMGVDKFDKQYAYNVRHMYGKEGKRTNYTAYSCRKIIMDNQPGHGEHHGCPFKHFDKHNLRAVMKNEGISESNIAEILDLVEGKHFQIACRKYFEVMHPNAKSGENSFEHPNQYFDASIKYHRAQQQGKEDQQQSQSQQLPISK